MPPDVNRGPTGMLPSGDARNVIPVVWVPTQISTRLPDPGPMSSRRGFGRALCCGDEVPSTRSAVVTVSAEPISTARRSRRGCVGGRCASPDGRRCGGSREGRGERLPTAWPDRARRVGAFGWNSVPLRRASCGPSSSQTQFKKAGRPLTRYSGWLRNRRPRVAPNGRPRRLFPMDPWLGFLEAIMSNVTRVEGDHACRTPHFVDPCPAILTWYLDTVIITLWLI
jgi:hypothetical protein